LNLGSVGLIALANFNNLCCMHSLSFFQKLVEAEIQKLHFKEEPADLYDPIRYMLSLGGKRIRPSLVLMSCELFDGNTVDALPAALGIEVFHNFTLLHDDVMDKAPLRRSRQTVHTRWNNDVALLSGDAMFVNSCQLMMQVKENVSAAVMNHFLESALLVCEGQQLDMTYQDATEISIGQYLEMIELKTAALLACALKTGALVAETSNENSELIHNFGKNLGIAFQLHDDILDVYGDEERFGKQTGGDIIANKKTYLMLKALELASDSQEKELRHWLTIKNFDDKEKVSAVKNIFMETGVKEKAESEMENYFQQSATALSKVNADSGKKQQLISFSEHLMLRQH
jgi:geranylgeranyl diphosphate synthase type II